MRYLFVILSSAVALNCGPKAESQEGTTSLDPPAMESTASASPTASSSMLQGDSTGDSGDSTGDHGSTTVAEVTGQSSTQTSEGSTQTTGGSNPGACDPFAQDCSAGQKCVPWGRHNNWDGAKCVDIMGDGVPGEPCTAFEGPTAGIDDCALGSICFDVDVELNNSGICTSQCSGSVGAPVCPEKFICDLYAEQYLAVCILSCDPLIVDDCPEDQACIPGENSFDCVKGAWDANQQVNDACNGHGACAKGLACLSSTSGSACAEGVGCCQPYCELPDGPCPDPDQSCQPWFDPRRGVPLGYEHVGVCAVSL